MKNITKIITAVLAVTMLMSVSGCGTTTTPAQPTPEPVEETAAPTLSPEEAKELAQSMVDGQVSDLIAAIGEPLSSDYASSCLGNGDDGELKYEGFTVYTYKEGDSEIIVDVD